VHPTARALDAHLREAQRSSAAGP